MTMTKQHFELIAETLRGQRGFELELSDGDSFVETRVLDGMALAFSRKLAATNLNFNRDRFLRACGVE